MAPSSVSASLSCAGSRFISPLQRISNQSWVDPYLNQVVDLDKMWRDGQPDGKNFEDCSKFDQKDGRFIDSICTNNEACFICAWNNEPTFSLRGKYPIPLNVNFHRTFFYTSPNSLQSIIVVANITTNYN